MNPFDPMNLLHLAAHGTMRNVTLALPTDVVRDMLPNGLELGPQDVTPEGTHPVVLGFFDIARLHASIPSLMPSLSYREHTVGIPFSHVARGEVTDRSPGPYFFMPRLLLDSFLAALGGVLFWGYPKRVATITSDASTYTVTWRGEQVISLNWKAVGEPAPLSEFQNFPPHQRLVSQPLLGMVPLSFGPFFLASGFPKAWDQATVQPIETATTIHTNYVHGLPAGRYPRRGMSKGIDASVIGGYEIKAPVQIGSPYPAWKY